MVKGQYLLLFWRGIIMTPDTQTLTQKRHPTALLWLLVVIGVAIVALLSVIVFKLQIHQARQPLQTSIPVPSQSAASGSTPMVTVTANQATTATIPSPPTHNYVYEKDGVYGYRQQLSQDDINAGTASKPLLMIRYLGEKDTVYRVVIDDGSGVEGVLSCKSPCNFITAETVENEQVVGTAVAPAAGTIAGDVMQDAINGYLKVYGIRKQ